MAQLVSALAKCNGPGASHQNGGGFRSEYCPVSSPHNVGRRRIGETLSSRV